MRARGDAARVSSKQVYRPVATHVPLLTLASSPLAALQQIKNLLPTVLEIRGDHIMFAPSCFNCLTVETRCQIHIAGEMAA